eukprot:TRINITY_DN51970_c0_g1_i1.p1 TRINITY_DN51970_c0_g1~~TRINITY_DN51970_c0_g1_i1.p1  ORF type:complete len:465 (-),score=60.22 TRINITY_DN51970_c0_g1_i1:75-1469(-)
MQMAQLDAHMWHLWPLLLGNLLEWYDFCIFGYLTPQISVNFFHGSLTGAWFGFAVAFLARPFGGLVVGWFADRFGRRISVTVTLIGMLVATVAQGILPTSRCCGEAAGTLGLVLLVLFRVIQGFCVGGELVSLVTYLSESASPGRKALATATYPATGAAAFVLASGVAALFERGLSHDQMLSWGWRVPFLLALFPAALGLWGRFHLSESPEFQDLQRRASQGVDSSIGDAQPTLKKDLACSCLSLLDGSGSCFLRTLLIWGGTAAWNGCFFFVVWCTGYLVHRGLAPDMALLTGCLTQLVVVLAVLSCALIGDARFNSDPFCFMLLGAALIAVLGFPMFEQLSRHPQDTSTVLLCLPLGLGIPVGVAVSHLHLFWTNLFPTKFRGTGGGISFNLGMSYIGGTAPLIAQRLLQASPRGPGIYISGLGLVSVVALLSGKLIVACDSDLQIARESDSSEETSVTDGP